MICVAPYKFHLLLNTLICVCDSHNCLCYQVCERPIIHLLDTPGVLSPKIENVETGMKLALCGKTV